MFQDNPGKPVPECLHSQFSTAEDVDNQQTNTQLVQVPFLSSMNGVRALKQKFVYSNEYR